MRSHDIVIVGAGPAGCAAAVQCTRLGVAPRLLDRTGGAGGLVANGFRVENYPGLEGPVSGEVFATRLREHLRRFEVEVAEATVESLQGHGEVWVVRCEGEDLSARCLILATGTAPKKLSIPGEADLAGGGLFYEVRDLLRVLPRPSRVLVAGSGEAAYDYALTLARAGAAVSILMRSGRSKACRRLEEMVEAEPVVTVETETRLLEMRPGKIGVTAVVEAGGQAREREVDAVLAAVGRTSALPGTAPGLLEGEPPLPLSPAPGFYLCGDARTGSLGQAGMAVGDGLAAAAMAVERVKGEGVAW
jgi:thioredoxin reductase (NADPH)